MTAYRRIIVVASVLSLVLSVRARGDAADQVNYQLVITTSLASRGAIFVLVGETPSATNPPGRHITMHGFRIREVGSDLTTAAVGWSGGDGNPFGSTSFWSPLVCAYLTAKNEPVVVSSNKEGSKFFADVPLPWCEGMDRTLIDFRPVDATGHLRNLWHRVPMQVEISGTMADHSLLITLRAKDRAYSFKYEPAMLPRWVRVPTPMEVPVTQPATGDQIGVSMIGQQRIGGNAHLVTVMAESPLPDGSGRRTAFYYFLDDSEDASELKYLASKTFDDRRAIGSGPGDEAAAEPTATLIHPIKSYDGRCSLNLGKDVLRFKYDYQMRQWVAEDNRGINKGDANLNNVMVRVTFSIP